MPKASCFCACPSTSVPSAANGSPGPHGKGGFSPTPSLLPAPERHSSDAGGQSCPVPPERGKQQEVKGRGWCCCLRNLSWPCPIPALFPLAAGGQPLGTHCTPLPRDILLSTSESRRDRPAAQGRGHPGLRSSHAPPDQAHLLQRGGAELDGDVVELLVLLGAEVTDNVRVLVRLPEQLDLAVHEMETLGQEALHSHIPAVKLSPA